MTKPFLSPDNLSRDPRAGYAALLSVIIIGALLTGIVLNFSGQVALSRLNSSDRILKEQSRVLAESCATKALLNYALDSGYTGHETIPVNGSQCTIGMFSLTADTLTIATSVNLNDIISTVQTVANTNDTNIVSQHEIIN